MNFIETHAHIYLEQFTDDLHEVIDRARANNVQRIYLPNIDQDTQPDLIKLNHEYPEVCFPMAGLHPCHIPVNWEEQLNSIKNMVDARSIAAIGEIGLDFYWDQSNSKHQYDAFESQIDWAIEWDLPIVIHTRDALDEAIKVVQKKKTSNLRGIFHCFTGSKEQARAIEELGFLMGLGGISTFKNAGMDQVIPHLKPEFIVLETDSPYLAPTPYRGKRNEPANIPVIAQKVAEYMQMPLQELASVTTKNALNLFAI